MLEFIFIISHEQKSVIFLNISTNVDKELRSCLLGRDRADRKSTGLGVPAAHTDLS